MFNPWVGNIPWRKAGQPTPVFLPGESHGQRCLAGCCPWGRKESNTTELLSTAHRVLFMLQADPCSWPPHPAPSCCEYWLWRLTAILYGAIGIDHLIHMLLVISPAPSCSSHFLIGLSLNKPPDAKNWLIGKDPDAGKDWRQKAKGTTEDEMVGWHHWHDGHEFEQAPGVGDGQGGLACCDSWGLKELDTTEWLNWTELKSPACKSLSQTLFLGNLT